MIEKTIIKDSEIEELIKNNLYAEAAELLFNAQLNEWQLMKVNYAAIKSVKLKFFWFDGFKFTIQFNPDRIKSTSAEVSEEAVNNRKCFLCVENLPSEQKGILLIDDYLLLCNPYPIFQKHFTISTTRHKPQSISQNIKDFLEITKLLAKRFTLIYNGPACGASAPDHLHFQALTKLSLPIENDIIQLKNEMGKVIFSDEKESVSVIYDGLRTIVYIEALELDDAFKLFKKFYDTSTSSVSSSIEPLMNLVCSYDEEFGFSLIVFLRSKHRPQCFFERDEKKILVSPAAVDLGGFVILPREEDFQKMNKHLLTEIIKEVSLEQSGFEEFERKLNHELS